MENLEKAFGQTLQQLRKDKGLSQEDLGLMSGCHRTYISLLERGQKSPSLRTLFGLAAALEVEPDKFVKQVQKIFTEWQQTHPGQSDRENR